ncbi:hypothetical protein SAMN05444165_1234 [Paraburkholderia phenazinium]|jgi:hypothetical protein|uniref:Uncharacterized protein n=1 Tax=Paraburkholderia phenazinium TaxID=60549 RepID=A0A1N6H8Z5_9BURK|nr:hypothetical protein SAMN05444165_1234 [Paraburkholderia phenazinium]
MKSRVSTGAGVGDWIEVIIGVLILNFVLFIASCLLELLSINKESRRLDELLEGQRRAAGLESRKPSDPSSRWRR